ncbi:hypothetical protein CW714_07355, partial [Methanophagales archaeon]
KRWKYHKISAIAMKTKRKRENGQRGRPGKDEPTQTVYRVKAEFAEDKSVIEKEMLKKRVSSSSLQTSWTARN